MIISVTVGKQLLTVLEIVVWGGSVGLFSPRGGTRTRRSSCVMDLLSGDNGQLVNWSTGTALTHLFSGLKRVM